MATTINLGRIGFINQGSWVKDKEYFENDIISFKNKVYCVKKAHTSSDTITPENTEYFDFWAGLDISDIDEKFSQTQLKIDAKLALKADKTSLEALKDETNTNLQNVQNEIRNTNLQVTNTKDELNKTNLQISQTNTNLSAFMQETQSFKDKTTTAIRTISDDIYSSTYKGVRALKASGVPFLLFFQYVERDKLTHKIVKFGDIFTQGIANSLSPVFLNTNAQHSATRLPFPYGEEITEIVTNYSYTTNVYNFFALIKDKNYMYAWGTNSYGCLGLIHTNAVPLPVKVNFSAKIKRAWITQLNWVNNNIYSAVELENGEVCFAGYNSDGQFGNGTTTGLSIFVKNNFLSDRNLHDIEFGAGLVTVPIFKNANNKFDIYACGYKHSYNLYLPNATQSTFIEIAKNADSYSVNNAFLKGDSSYCVANIAYVKNGIGYVIGRCGKSTGKANAHDKSTDKAMPYLYKEKPIKNVEQVVLANYHTHFVLRENGELYMYAEVSHTMPFQNNIDKDNPIEIKNFDNGFELLMKDVEKLIRVKQDMYLGYIVLAVMKNGDVYYLSAGTYCAFGLNSANPITNGSLTELSGNNSMQNLAAAKLDLPCRWGDVIENEICTFHAKSNNFLGSLVIGDGKRLWIANAAYQGSGTSLIMPYGFRPFELPQFERK